MNELWIGIGGLLVVVLAILLTVAARSRRDGTPSRADFDIAVFKDQLAELDRDRERGLVSETEFASARTEIERRLLGAANDADADSDRDLPKTARYTALATIVLLPVGAIALYFSLGSPQFPGAPYAARDIQAERVAAEQQRAGADMVALVEKLANGMKSRPDDIRGWLLLGRSYLALGRGDDAIAAIRRARELAPERGEIAVELAEALIVSADNAVTPEARTLLESAVGADPYSPKPRYYIALGQAQSGEVTKAIQGWTDLVAISPANAPWLPTVREQINNAARDIDIDPATMKPSFAARMLAKSIPAQPVLPGAPPTAAPGPSQADVNAAADMNADDRQAMIRTMVQRLADKLKDNPDDLQGWIRLERAYRVLGDTKKADEAAAHVQALGG